MFEPNGTDLLTVFDALVARDTGPPGFRGHIAIAVRSADGYRFWSAKLDTKIETTFGTQPVDEAGATLYLGEREARAILADGRLPRDAELLMIDGDRSLISRFIARYTTRTNWLGIRMY